MTGEEYNYIDLIIYPTLSITSTVLASLVVIIMIGLSLYDFKLVNRVSLRLQTAISAIDIWTHTTPFWIVNYNKEGFMCTFIAWQRFYGPLLYLFFNASIVFNLQYIFLMDKTVNSKVELLYWIGPIGLGLVITLPILFSGALGYSQYSGCFLNDRNALSNVLSEVFGSFIWNILILIYSIIIVILVTLKLRRNVQKIWISKRFKTLKESKRAVSKANVLINRILLYPIVAIISTTGVMVSQLYVHIMGNGNYGLDSWASISLALTGTLNFLAFMMDPTLHSAFYTIYARITNAEENSLELAHPESNPNEECFDSSLNPRLDSSASFSLIGDEGQDQYHLGSSNPTAVSDSTVAPRGIISIDARHL